MRRIITWVFIGLIVITTIAVLTGCSSGPTSGYIWAKNYTPPSSEYFPPMYEPQECYGSGTSRYCSGGYWEAGYTDYYPAEWQYQLCSEPLTAHDNKNNCGWMDVDQGTYDKGVIGNYYSIKGTPAPTDTKVTSNDGVTN